MLPAIIGPDQLVVVQTNRIKSPLGRRWQPHRRNDKGPHLCGPFSLVELPGIEPAKANDVTCEDTESDRA